MSNFQQHSTQDWVSIARSLRVGESARFIHCGSDAAATVYNHAANWNMFCHRCKKYGMKYKQFVQPTILNNEYQIHKASVPDDLISIFNLEEPYKTTVFKFLLEKGIDPKMVPEDTYFSPIRYRIVFPSQTRNERIVSALGRTLHPDVKPKWLNYGEKVNFVSTMFNGWDYVVLTEDYLSALKVQWSINTLTDHSITVIPLRGTHVCVQLRKKLLMHSKALLCMLDGDKAGYEGTHRIIKDLKGMLPVSTFAVDGFDPKDLSVTNIVDGVNEWISA